MQYYQLLKLVSQPRLARYLRASNGNESLSMQAYFLNMDISGNLFKAISFLEISLRNRINEIVPHATQLKADQWLIELLNKRAPSNPEFNNTKKKIREAIKLSKDETHDQVICQLSFGFWCSLFSGYNYTIIGSRIMKYLHPRRKQEPKELRGKLHKIRTIRNRIAHQEPIIFDTKNHFNSVYLKTILRDIYSVQTYIYSHKFAQIAFYKQIEQDIERLDLIVKKAKTQRFDINQ